MSFEKYGLSPEILSGLADVRIDKPTSLLEELLPAALQGKHLLVNNATADEGTFLIPALQKVAESGESSGTQVLILTPSIERAAKIDELVWAIGYHAQISSALMAMKGDKAEQEKALLDGAPVIVANPGRFIEILEKNTFRLQQLKLIVIDEAHEMENFNLVNRVKDIFAFVDNEPQVLVLSGTKNSATERLVSIALKNPELIGFEVNGNGTKNQENEPVDTPVLDEEQLEVVKEKLEEAAVEVVLNPEASKEEEAEQTELEEIKEKLEEAEVEVVLSEDLEETSTEEPTAETKQVEVEEEVVAANVDLNEVRGKLEKAGIKVVLKKDLPKEEDQPKAAAETVDEDAPEPLAKELEQGYINVPPRMKISTLMAHLEESNSKKVIVFAASNRTTDRLFRIIRKKNWGVVSIDEELEQNIYEERFAKFTSGEMRVLLVGGIPANKVEIEAVDEVINYDVPGELDEYRYRAELVGGGKAARIISLVSKMDREDMERISEEAGFPPVELPFPEELSDKKKKKAPAQKSAPKKAKKSPPKAKNNNRGGGNKSSGRNNQKKKSNKPKSMETSLPRPTYDGLKNGRNGEVFNPKKEPEKAGVFGWVKKLFK